MSDEETTGAEALVRTLHAAGVRTCFANPGTSEMQFVSALDRTGLIRCVLCLFEGVASGAADGYARMTGRPAATLLHLGPGLANAGANIHNARKAASPMVNLVGEHAQRHLAHDAPLTADIAGLAAPLSHWVRTARSAAGIAADGAEAVAEARSWPGRIATLVAPGDTGWEPGGRVAEPLPPRGPREIDAEALEAAAAALEAPGRTLLYVGGAALADRGALALARAIAERTGSDLLAPTSNARIERGAGIAPVDRVPYAIDLALERLAPHARAVLVGAPAPVGFFAYPGRPSLMLPEGCDAVPLAAPDQDPRAALALLAERIGARPGPLPAPPARPGRPAPGRLDPDSLAAAIGHALPEGAIVADEGISAGRGVWAATAGAPTHTWLALTGGAIGIGPPLATGAAVACPDRPVVAIQADGSAMYTIQALWTQAREGLNVTTVILANRAYASLEQELHRVGANPGPSALSLLDLSRPDLDFVALARGHGVEAARVDCPALLADTLSAAVRTPGPTLIEAVLP
jgi:acetolactate synthase-1/2/3 large subunit